MIGMLIVLLHSYNISYKHHGQDVWTFIYYSYSPLDWILHLILNLFPVSLKL